MKDVTFWIIMALIIWVAYMAFFPPGSFGDWKKK